MNNCNFETNFKRTSFSSTEESNPVEKDEKTSENNTNTDSSKSEEPTHPYWKNYQEFLLNL